jgi:myo-inositol-1(or 4)-monophosphatase
MNLVGDMRKDIAGSSRASDAAARDPQLILAAEQAVDIDARIFRQGRVQIGALIAKGDRYFASSVDLEIETAIKTSLSNATPRIAFLGQEHPGHGDVDQTQWALTPIDGTINFARHGVYLAVLASLARSSLRVRMHGSAVLDLAWLAAGRLNATLMLSNLPSDVTVGLLLAREARGVVFDCGGSERTAGSRFTLASEPPLREAIAGIAREAM